MSANNLLTSTGLQLLQDPRCHLSLYIECMSLCPKTRSLTVWFCFVLCLPVFVYSRETHTDLQSDLYDFPGGPLERLSSVPGAFDPRVPLGQLGVLGGAKGMSRAPL